MPNSVTAMNPAAPESIFVDTPQASGWLSWPTASVAAAPQAHAAPARAAFEATQAAALAQGFVPIEALILAHMARRHALRHSGSITGFALDSANLPHLSLPDTAPRAAPGTPMPQFARLSNADLGLYAVVDSAAWVQRVLEAGVRTVQLRFKNPHDPALRGEIRQSIAAASQANAQLFINDHWQLAIEEGAYGVHLGQEDLAIADLAAVAKAGLRLGISTHAYWEVCRAWALQPSYIACGPVHATNSKDMPWTPQGNDNLAYWSALLSQSGSIPVVGIAGMDATRVGEAAQCGAAAAAVITAITAAPSPETAISKLQQAWATGKAGVRWPVPSQPRPTLR